MNFDQPMSLEKALELLRQKKALPTNLSTADLRGLAKDVRKLSLYSARTTSLDYLAEIRQVAMRMLKGEINEATARQEVQLFLDKFGYTPEKHFGDDATIEPAEKGSLKDLSSDARVKLVLQTNTRMVANYGFMEAGRSPDAMAQYPCWELVRIFPRVKERQDWEERWVTAGGTLYDGRMVARKDDPIWSNLGDSGLFADGTDSDAPPYAFNSGMGIRDVSRAEAEELGVISEGEEIGQPAERSLLGDWFDEPEKVTMGDLSATRSELLKAASKLRSAA